MIVLPKPNNKIEYAFPFIVLGLSMVGLANMTIFNGINSINFLKIAVSLLGITAFILYILNIKSYVILFQLWALTQIIVIARYLPDLATNQYIEKSIWDTTQVYNYSFFLSGKTHSNIKYEIGINVLGFVYLGFSRLLYLSSLIGTKISLRSFKKDSFLSAYLPTTATVQQRITLSDEKNWLLIKLAKKKHRRES